jgi:hypothetical protein
MYRIFIKTLPFALISAALLCSCGGISKKDYEAIQGRKYKFTRFYIFQSGTDQEHAMKLMKTVQADRLCRILEHKFGVSVDSSEYELFIFSGDYTKIATGGLLKNLDFTWESGSGAADSMELSIFIRDKQHSADAENEFNLLIRAGGENRLRISGTIMKFDDSLQTMAKRLRYKRLNENSDDIYASMDTGEQVRVAESPDRETRLALEVAKNYTGNLEALKSESKKRMDAIPVKDRRKFRNDMVKYLDELVK